MFSIAKLLDGNPESHKFLTCTVFVFDDRSKKLAAILVEVKDGEILGAHLHSCNKGPENAQELIDHLKKILQSAKEGTRLIYKEPLKSLNDVDDFAVDHLWLYFGRASVMGTHEDIAEMLRKCFPKP